MFQIKESCIASEAPAPAAVEKDMMAAESIGKQAKEKFNKERLYTKERFLDPVKKSNLKAFQSDAKRVKAKTAETNYHIQTAQQVWPYNFWSSRKHMVR